MPAKPKTGRVTAPKEKPEPTVEEETPQETGGVNGIRVPLPVIPLPLNVLLGVIGLGNQFVILVTGVNDAGSMIQGYLSPEVAARIGRDLMAAARDADTKQSLIVPEKKLLVPATGQ